VSLLGAAVCIAAGLCAGWTLFVMGAAVERHARRKEIDALRKATSEAVEQAKRVIAASPLPEKPTPPPNKITRDGGPVARDPACLYD